MNWFFFNVLHVIHNVIWFSDKCHRKCEFLRSLDIIYTRLVVCYCWYLLRFGLFPSTWNRSVCVICADNTEAIQSIEMNAQRARLSHMPESRFHIEYKSKFIFVRSMVDLCVAVTVCLTLSYSLLNWCVVAYFTNYELALNCQLLNIHIQYINNDLVHTIDSYNRYTHTRAR